MHADHFGDLGGDAVPLLAAGAKNHQVGHPRPLHGFVALALEDLHLATQLALDILQGNRHGFVGGGRGDGRGHRILHCRPSASIRRSASTGPQVPHWYSGTFKIRSCSQACRIGMTNCQAASTASRRMNRVASPAMTSSNSRSYASGETPPKLEL